MQKRTTVDDGSIIIEKNQLEAQFEATCGVLFQDSKRARLSMPSPEPAQTLAQPVSTNPQESGSTAEEKDEETEAVVLAESVPALRAKLGVPCPASVAMAAPAASAGKVKAVAAHGKAKAKAKAKGKAGNLGKNSPDKQDRGIPCCAYVVRLSAVQAAVPVITTKANELCNKVEKCVNLDELKAFEPDMKDMVVKVDKQDLLIAAGGEDLLEDMVCTSGFLAGAFKLVKAWKGMLHQCNEKSRAALAACFKEFKQQLEGDSLKHTPAQLMRAAASDLIKSNVNQSIHKGVWGDAAQELCPSTLWSKYGLDGLHASQAQSTHAEDLYKKLIRRYHDTELAK
eukprot:4928980-Amphidinium_carterae.1